MNFYHADEIEDLKQGILPEKLNPMNFSNDQIQNWDHFGEFKIYFESEDLEELIFHQNSLQIITDQLTTEVKLNENQERLFHLLTLRLILKENQVFNETNAYTSFECFINKNFYRVTLTHQILSAEKKMKAFFRKKRNCLTNNIPTETISYLTQKKNIIIAGETGSGKTTFIQSILTHCPPTDHYVLIEDPHEIKMNHPFVSYLSAKSTHPFKLIDFCEISLRMRPDRFIIGEIKGSEIIPLILTMNNGHKGLLTSIHAESSKKAIERMAMLFSLYKKHESLSYNDIIRLICQSIDYVVVLKDKKIIEFMKVLGSENGTPYIDPVFSSQENSLLV